MNNKNSWKSIIIKTMFVSGFIVIGLNIYGNLDSSKNDESYAEKKMTIKQMESSEPLKFLNINGSYDKSFWGTKIKIKGRITNKASMVTFKDATVRVTYYSKTKTALGSKDFIVYELFQPNSSRNFEFKVDNYKNVNSVGLDIVDISIK